MLLIMIPGDYGHQEIGASTKTKQPSHDIKEVMPEGLHVVKKNFKWAADRVELLLNSDSQCRVVVLMGLTSDLGHCGKK
jgi:phosphoribosylaminoimidazole carboxylase/phosphoribosylaminoimidazole-succinocarboxamide synthase